MKWDLDRVWCLGRHAKTWYIRFYPNPGFFFTIGKRRLRWSKFYGWK